MDGVDRHTVTSDMIAWELTRLNRVLMELGWMSLIDRRYGQKVRKWTKGGIYMFRIPEEAGLI
jgi:hypothetical protein